MSRSTGDVVLAADATRRQRAAAWAARRQRSRRHAVKRVLDVVAGTTLLVVSLPLVGVLAAISAVSLRAWPFFVQVRPGRNGTPFRIVKIRSLPRSMPGYGHKDDLAAELRTIPRVCELLRRSHLDELPQLALVVAGRMSLVGPRPSQPMQYEHIDQTFEWMRTAVRPGCTGLWQIGAAHELALDADPEYDTFYLEHMSLRLDLWTLAYTALFLIHVVRPISTSSVPRWVLGRERPAVRSGGEPPHRGEPPSSSGSL